MGNLVILDGSSEQFQTVSSVEGENPVIIAWDTARIDR
jgi:hypothetical protein